MENNTSKKLTVLALILFILFAGINVFWIITMYIPHRGYEYSIAEYKNKYSVRAERQDEKEYFLLTAHLAYLGYDDFVNIAIEVPGDTKDLVINSLYVYTNIWGDYEYFVGYIEDGSQFFYA